mgnify:CR=1 FL=1
MRADWAKWNERGQIKKQGNPHSSENWRRPVNYDKANLVENMELNK